MGSNMTFQHPESSDKKKRSIQKQPYKVLEVPQLKDDFYLNLIDWSQNNHVAVGLQSSLYVWSGCSSRVQKIYSSEDYSDYICSVAFGKNNPYLAFGNTSGEVQLFDLNKNKQHTMFSNVHAGRIGSLGCTPNLISTGGRDGIITIQDYRTRTEVTSYKAHQQEICGLKWSPDFQMIASGGNDNKLVLYSLRMMNKMATFSEHKAAVKALSFDPNAPIIASGGGTADRHIRFFSTQSLTEVYSIDTGSQVCNLMFSPISRELVTTHGYSLNQINLWKVGDNCVEKL
jgi:cell division cycle 20-like protein 1 (cofactor of APC complex)